MTKYFFLFSVMSIFLFACGDNTNKQVVANNQSPELTQHQKDQRNKAIALACIRAYAAKDSEFILSHNADSVINIYSGQPPIHGIDSCRIVLRDAFNTFNYKPSNEHALADSNCVFVFLYADAFLTKSHETDHAEMVEMFKFNDDGKIILHTAVGQSFTPKDVRISF